MIKMIKKITNQNHAVGAGALCPLINALAPTSIARNRKCRVILSVRICALPCVGCCEAPQKVSCPS